MCRTLFISDLHLSDHTEAISDRFFYFLNYILKAEDSLYILGDFFEYWLGQDCMTLYQKNILDRLSLLPNTIYFLPGNRDFLIEPTLLNRYGIHYLSDPTIHTIQSKRILLGHGDLWCTDNISYQRFRRVARHPFTQFCFRRLPQTARLAIAKTLRGKKDHLKQHNHKLKNDSYLQSMTYLEDINLYAALPKKTTIDYLIHGHTHHPILELVWKKNTPPLQRIALSDWSDEKGNVCLLEDGRHFFHFF